MFEGGGPGAAGVEGDDQEGVAFGFDRVEDVGEGFRGGAVGDDAEDVDGALGEVEGVFAGEVGDAEVGEGREVAGDPGELVGGEGVGAEAVVAGDVGALGAGGLQELDAALGTQAVARSASAARPRAARKGTARAQAARMRSGSWVMAWSSVARPVSSPRAGRRRPTANGLRGARGRRRGFAVAGEDFIGAAELLGPAGALEGFVGLRGRVRAAVSRARRASSSRGRKVLLAPGAGDAGLPANVDIAHGEVGREMKICPAAGVAGVAGAAPAQARRSARRGRGSARQRQRDRGGRRRARLSEAAECSASSARLAGWRRGRGSRRVGSWR
ncbi:MAG: hypothetical protein U0841_19735 [Chloroflexia bacterium]